MGYEFDWGLPFRKPYSDWLLDGMGVTMLLTLVSTLGSFLLGVCGACFRTSSFRSLRWTAIVYVEIFRNIPTMFWIFFFYFLLPTLLPETLGGQLNRWSGLPLTAACTGLLLSNGAHVAEIIRSGIQSLPKKQQASGLALGLHPLRVWWSIILPQALQVSLPALGPRMAHNFHNTSLALVISVQEFTWQTQQIESITFRGFEAVTIASLFFISITLLITTGFRLLERRGARRR
jgi:polar amino acid transport system permease protein